MEECKNNFDLKVQKVKTIIFIIIIIITVILKRARKRTREGASEWRGEERKETSCIIERFII